MGLESGLTKREFYVAVAAPIDEPVAARRHARRNGFRSRTSLAVIVLGAALLTVTFQHNAVAQDDYKYDARGFSANRDTFNQFPWEHIDPMTGNVLLTFTDVELPGNAGFDLKIARTYNSKEYRGGVFGVGWTSHFGRVYHTPTIAPTLDNPTPPPPTWIIEWSDGSQHECYITSSSTLPAACVTADLWSYDPTARRLYLPNGRVYQFDWVAAGGDPANPDVPHYATATDKLPFESLRDLRALRGCFL